MRWLLASCLLAVSHAVCAEAAAQAGAVHGAEALFDEGRKLMTEQRYDEACAKFAASQRLDPALGTLLNLAYCWKQSGKTASAWTAYREAASLAFWQHQAEREAFARAEAAELGARLARLNVRVVDGDRPGFELKRDDAVVPREVWGMDVPVNPGEYTIEAAAPDHERFVMRVTVNAGQSVEVTIPALAKRAQDERGDRSPPSGASTTTVPQAAAAVERTATASAARASPQRDGRATLSALGVGAGALGLVAFGVSGAFALRMQSHDSKARGICTEEAEPCSVAQVGAHERHKQAARESRTIAYVGAGAGVACALGAVAMFMLASSASKATRTDAPDVAVAVAPGALSVFVHGRM